MEANSRKSTTGSDMHNDMQKHTGEYPMIGVDTLREAPATIKRLGQDANDNGNVMVVPKRAVLRCSLGPIAGAMFQVGGPYRRGM